MRQICSGIANEIYIGQDYSAYLSTLTTGSDLSHARFGSNSSYRTISISDGDSNDVADSAILDDAGALARYQMAAFLAALEYANADKAFEQAAEWYANPSSNRSFLSDFLIVSDATMSSGGVGDPVSGGFQEQLTMLIGLSIVALLRRPALAVKGLSPRGCFHGTYQTVTPIVPVLALGSRTSTH
jgi:hypothetical protein